MARRSLLGSSIHGFRGISAERATSATTISEAEAYALDRALRSRDVSFPIIGIFLEPIENELVPPAIRTRLYTDISAPDWVERVRAGVEGRAPAPTAPVLEAYQATVHHHKGNIILEIRPRSGRWRPVVAAVPASEEKALLRVLVGVRDEIPNWGEFMSATAGALHIVKCDEFVDPNSSAYVFSNGIPSELFFGGPKERHRLSREQLIALAGSKT